MGRKINPKLFRLGLSENWKSRWFGGREYAELLEQDIKIRKFLQKKLKASSIDSIDIERNRGEISIHITAAKPGLIIGRGGSGIEDLKKEILGKFVDRNTKLQLNVKEVSNPNLSAAVVLQSIAEDIEKRMPFRRVMKQNIEKVMKARAKGVKIILAGRLNGVDIARSEKLLKGTIPLSTLRADIDYSRGTASTTYGVIGIKVWIYKGEVFAKKDKKNEIKDSGKTFKLFSKEKPEIQAVDNKSTIGASLSDGQRVNK
ncbi:30S ribosomal protein S3 [bacterium]|jgi:small subunit ribosomal protein S3|nr:30S ribosomal protein S3 [bacterium]MBT4649524.1 30S ribosomal protein S3 [bacterium]